MVKKSTALHEGKWSRMIRSIRCTWTTGAYNSIIILDENNQVCDYLRDEVQRNFKGVVKQVIDSQKPISIILFDNVYIISLESLFFKK